MVMPIVYPFSTQQVPVPETPNLAQVGGKGLSLMRMAQQGLPVPPGFVLTVAFFQPWLEAIQATPEWAGVVSSVPQALKANCEAAKVAGPGVGCKAPGALEGEPPGRRIIWWRAGALLPQNIHEPVHIEEEIGSASVIWIVLGAKLQLGPHVLGAIADIRAEVAKVGHGKVWSPGAPRPGSILAP